MNLLTVSAAARRVRRDRRTIRRWIRAGMPALELKDARGNVVGHYVQEDVLLRFFRRALDKDPTRDTTQNDA